MTEPAKHDASSAGDPAAVANTTETSHTGPSGKDAGSGCLRPWDRPRRFLLEAPFWTLLVATLVGAALGMKEQSSARGVALYAMLGFGWGTAASMYWFLQSGWMRTLLRLPYVRNTAMSHAVGFGLGALLTGRPPMLCGWVAVSAFLLGYLRGVLSEKTVADLGVTRRALERLMSQQGSSLRAAAIIIQRAVAAHPRDAWLRYARAVVLTSRHPRSLRFPEFYPDYTTREEAITDLNLAIDLDRSLTDAWLLRARQKTFFTGAPELGLDLAFNADNVLADFNEAIRLAPQRADIYFERGLFYEQRLQEYSKAEADFSKSIKLSEPAAENLLARGRVRFYRDAFESVIEDMSRVIQLDPDGVAGDAFCFRGEARRALGLLDEAASDFRLAIEARRDSLRRCGDTRSAEEPDDRVFEAAHRGLVTVQQSSALA